MMVVYRIEDEQGRVNYRVCDTTDNPTLVFNLEDHKDETLMVDTYKFNKSKIEELADLRENPNCALTKEDIEKIDAKLGKSAEWITTKEFADENSLSINDYKKEKGFDIKESELESKISWKELEKFNITKDSLKKSGNYERLMMGQETSKMPISTKVGNYTVVQEGTLKLNKGEDGEIGWQISDAVPFKHIFSQISDEQKTDLSKDGRCFVSYNGNDYAINKNGNEIKIDRLPELKLEKIKQDYDLTDKQTLMLRNGESLNVEHTDKDGKQINTKIRLDNLTINNETRQEAKDLMRDKAIDQLPLKERIFAHITRSVLRKAQEEKVEETEGAGVRMKRRH